MKTLAIILLASFASAQGFDPLVPAAPSISGTQFYVSPLGSDSNNGTSTATPFATIDKARQAASGKCNGAFGPVTVSVRNPGNSFTYYQGAVLGSPLTFSGGTVSYPSLVGTNDNGCSPTSPVIYQAYPGETPVISGGNRLTGWTTTGFTCSGACTQYSQTYSGPYFENLWYTRAGTIAIGSFSISSNVVTFATGTQTVNVGDVVTISGMTVGTYLNNVDMIVLSASSTQFTAAFTHANVSSTVDCGTGTYQQARRFRPRLGATSGNNIANYLRICAAGTCGGKSALVLTTDACSLSSNGCAAGTNSGCQVFPATGNCWDRIRLPAGALANWANLSASGAPACDVEFFLWEIWTVPIMRACAVDLTNNLIIFSGLMNTGSSSNNGPMDGHRYMIENEKDSNPNAILLPGQWFLDSTVSPRKLYYNAAPGENPNTDTVEVPVLNHAMRTYNAQYLTFRGLVFEHDNWTVPSAGYISNQAEPSVWGAVSIQSSQHINFENSTVQHTSGDGIEFFPCRNSTDGTWCVAFSTGATTVDNNFQHGTVWDTGVNGMQMGSKTLQSTDTDSNVAQVIVFNDNAITGTGRRVPSAFGISVGSGHDAWFTHNEIFETYHAGIAVCTPPCTWGAVASHGVFNVNSFFNSLHNITQAVVSDIGGLYYATGYGSSCGTSNRIFNNLVHDVNDPGALPGGDIGAQGGHGIYLDNLTCLVDVQNNVVYRVSAAAMNFSKGIPLSGPGISVTGPNNINNNIFAYARQNILSTGNPSEWINPNDYTPPNNCAVGNGNTIRLHFKYTNNVAYADRNDASSGVAFYFQRGCVDSCGAPFKSVQFFQGNIWQNTSVTLSTYAKAFHVTTATAAPIGPGQGTCGVQNTNWTFATPANWQCAAGCSFTNNAGGASTPVVIPNEDAGAAFADPGFVSPGYPNDNYTLTCPLLGTSFNCAATNSTLTSAGRQTNASVIRRAVKTYPTAEWDPNHTNNGDF